jgi:hypothetical protein
VRVKRAMLGFIPFLRLKTIAFLVRVLRGGRWSGGEEVRRKIVRREGAGGASSHKALEALAKATMILPPQPLEL